MEWQYSFLLYILIGGAILIGIVFLAAILYDFSKHIKNKKIKKFFQKIADFLVGLKLDFPP